MREVKLCTNQICCAVSGIFLDILGDLCTHSSDLDRRSYEHDPIQRTRPPLLHPVFFLCAVRLRDVYLFLLYLVFNVAIYLWNPFPRLDLRLGKGASFPQAWGNVGKWCRPGLTNYHMCTYGNL